jgi:hypothetical protein
MPSSVSHGHFATPRRLACISTFWAWFSRGRSSTRTYFPPSSSASLVTASSRSRSSLLKANDTWRISQKTAAKIQECVGRAMESAPLPTLATHLQLGSSHNKLVNSELMSDINPLHDAQARLTPPPRRRLKMLAGSPLRGTTEQSRQEWLCLLIRKVPQGHWIRRDWASSVIRTMRHPGPL